MGGRAASENVPSPNMGVDILKAFVFAINFSLIQQRGAFGLGVGWRDSHKAFCMRAHILIALKALAVF